MNEYSKGDRVTFNVNGIESVGEVLSTSQDFLQVKTTIEGEPKIFSVAYSNVVHNLKFSAKMDVDNMVNLGDLSALSMLENLRTRYFASKIYTYIGNIVITVNPYKDLLIDGPEVMMNYFNRVVLNAPPHLYGLAENLFQAAIRNDFNQVVVISGESGSGKTEAFKRITQYLANASEKGRNALSSVAKRVLESTPLLESFGNATTLRNDNSSRFGKYVEIYFAKSIIIGAKITNFLLEKSRIVKQLEKERNYHAFYELLSSLDNASKAKHQLTNIDDYYYLTQDKKHAFTTHSDPDGLVMLLEGWRTLGLSKDEMDLCLRVISAVLHLGNINFKNDADKASYKMFKQIETCVICNPNIVKIAASELGVNENELAKVITMKLTETSIESLWSPVNESGAKINRDSIAKNLYSEFFDRLVEAINQRISPPIDLDTEMKSSIRQIAILDIYGFENFPHNSLEQFCINYTNENLQQFFNHYIFELEQEEYKNEDISWKYIEFPDNQPIIDLIASKPNGIMHICNDEASLATGNDESFLQRCIKYHRDHPNFKLAKMNQKSSFIIEHFAGKIVYNVNEFVDKNRDKMRAEVLSLLTKSTNPAVAHMFKAIQLKRTRKNNSGPKLKAPMVLGMFNNSLQLLLEKMKKNRPSFVRCIKPNMHKQPMVFDDSTVIDQLRYSGLLEAVRIRKSGFPVRIDYDYFVKRYAFLTSWETKAKLKEITNPKQAAEWIIAHINVPLGVRGFAKQGADYEFGKKKIFLRDKLVINLEALRSLTENHASRTIQRAWRRREAGLIERARRNAAKVIQAWYRGSRTRRENIEIVQYLANRSKEFKASEIQQDSINPTEPVRPLSEDEILHLEVPSDLAYLLENRKIGQEKWLELHKVIKPGGSIRRLVTSHVTGTWHHYGRPVWGAAPLADVIKSAGSRAQMGYRLAPWDRPMFLTRPNEKILAACVAASKLILRLVFLPNMSIQEQFLIGSYLYQLALSQKSLHKELIIQLLSQTINWPKKITDLIESNGEDESSQFQLLNGKSNLMLIDQNDSTDLLRRAYRRLWMHIAGMITCGQLSKTLTPVVIRFIRQNAPARSSQLCEDRVVLEPTLIRLYPPCLLEWRINYCGVNMGVNVTFTDGISSVFHAHSFTRAETLAGMAIALRTYSGHIRDGWTISIHYAAQILDVPGYYYVCDIFSQKELPDEWNYLNNILPHLVLPTYPNFVPKVSNKERNLINNYNHRNDDVFNTKNNQSKMYSHYSVSAEKLAKNIHGIKMQDVENNSNPQTSISHSVNSNHKTNTQAQWLQAVRKMANKRFNEFPKTESWVRKASIRRKRSYDGIQSKSLQFPRSKSPGDIFEDTRFGQTEGISSKKSGGVLPHEMRYYIYDHPPWAVRVRKEFITPSERIRTTLMVNLIFHQIIADLIDESYLRLNDSDRKQLLRIIGPNYHLNSNENVREVPIDIKKKVVAESLNLPIYFGRFYPVQDFELTPSPNLSQWLVVSHHGIRLVLQNKGSQQIQIHTLLNLGEIEKVTVGRTLDRPRWRCGDGTTTDGSQIRELKSTEISRPPLSRSGSAVSSNLITIIHSKGKRQLYTDMADRLHEFIELFLREYRDEITRLKEAAQKRALRASVPNHLSINSPDCSSGLSTPEVSFRLACSPPLLATNFPENDFSSFHPTNRKNLLETAPLINRKQSNSPKRIQQTFQSISKSQFDPTDSPLSDPEFQSTPMRKVVPSSPNQRPQSSVVHGNISPSQRTDSSIPYKEEIIPTQLKPSGSVDSTNQVRSQFQNDMKDHPLFPYARQFFLKKDNLVEELNWSSRPPQKGSLLIHSDPNDIEAACKIFMLIQQFTEETISNSPQYVVLQSLIEMLFERPWLSDELYCQLVKQTRTNTHFNSNLNEPIWFLWRLVSVFVPATDLLRPYLIKFIEKHNSKSQKLQDSTRTNLEIVSRFGPRKHLPPKIILQLLVGGQMNYRQLIRLPDGKSLNVLAEQLSLVQDIIHSLVEKFDGNVLNATVDFILYLSPKGSSAYTHEGDSLIPLQLDTYILDAPIYQNKFDVCFRRICWPISFDLHSLSINFVKLLFEQLAEEYLHGVCLPSQQNEPVKQDQCLNLSSLICLGRGIKTPISSKLAISLKPKKLIISSDLWTTHLNQIVKNARFKNCTDAQQTYLRNMCEWSFCGSLYFYGFLETDPPNLLKLPSRNNEVLLALTRTGLKILHKDTNVCLKEYTYEDIANTKVNYVEDNEYTSSGIVRLVMDDGSNVIVKMLQARIFVFILNRYQYILSTNLLAAN